MIVSSFSTDNLHRGETHCQLCLLFFLFSMLGLAQRLAFPKFPSSVFLSLARSKFPGCSLHPFPISLRMHCFFPWSTCYVPRTSFLLGLAFYILTYFKFHISITTQSSTQIIPLPPCFCLFMQNLSASLWGWSAMHIFTFSSFFVFFFLFFFFFFLFFFLNPSASSTPK